MLLIALFWLNQSKTYSDEYFFLKWTSLFKKSVWGEDKKPSPDSVLYIDVSGSKSLINIKDPLYEEDTGFHNRAITNRQHLSSFLNYVRRYGEGIPLLVLDLTFELESPHDSLLQSSIDSFPFHILGASRFLNKGGFAPRVIDLPTAAGNYLTSDRHFTKYPLYLNDSFPTLPLAMLGIIDGALFKKRTFWPTVNGNISLSNPIIDFKIRPFDFKPTNNIEKKHFTVFSLGTLLFEWEFWDESDIRSMLKNKLIIVGDFKEDIHETVFGTIAGPIVVHNAYLTLQEGGNLISWIWLLLLFGLFWWMSFRVAQTDDNKSHIELERWRKTALSRIIIDSFDEAIILAVATIVSYLVFNIHINILILLIYLKVINYFKVTLFQRWRF